jgi:hypothetical protein
MLIPLGNRQVHITEGQFDALEMLKLCANGGFATAVGYKPTSNWETVPTMDYQFVSKFSTRKLYQRRMDALTSIAFADLNLSHPKLKALDKATLQIQFAECMKLMVESHKKTLDGDRSDAHRQAHDEFYAPVCQGVKVHLLTEKRDGKTVLVTGADINPVVDTIMLSGLVIGSKTRVEGKRKVVNSGPKVLMDNAIEAAWKGKHKLSMITLSLKADNHDHIRIGGEILDAALHAEHLAYLED